MSQPIRLRYGKVYHIYNRGNNGDNIFIEERNYHYFLQLYIKHIHPVVDTYAYCLLRNHFHLLVRIKKKAEIEVDLKPPSQYFSNFFNAYAKAINRAYERTGSLFERPFQRIQVSNRAYFARLVVYIHRNPKRHGFVDDLCDWPFSSYGAIRVEDKPTRVRRDVVLEWFEGVEAFEVAQRTPVELPEPLMLECF